MAAKRIVLAIAFASALVSAGVPAAAQERPRPVKGTIPVTLDSKEEQIKQAVALARAGRKLTPKEWPNGAQVAVCLSFDVDNEAEATPSPLPVGLSEGEYGALSGLPRILALLDRHEIPASFFIPAMSAMLHPQMVEEITKRERHEIGVHGWVHEYLPGIEDPAQEERLLNQAIEYLTKAAGKRPVGYRAPSWAFSEHTLDQIRGAGFLYDSSMMAMDEPYEIVSKGKATGLVELPVDWILDDYPYFTETAKGSLPSPEAVFQVYKDEFDVAHQEKTLFVLTMHPSVTGHRSRIVQLDRLIAYMKSKPGVWFATLEQVAAYVKQGK